MLIVRRASYRKPIVSRIWSAGVNSQNGRTIKCKSVAVRNEPARLLGVGWEFLTVRGRKRLKTECTLQHTPRAGRSDQPLTTAGPRRRLLVRVLIGPRDTERTLAQESYCRKRARRLRCRQRAAAYTGTTAYSRMPAVSKASCAGR